MAVGRLRARHGGENTTSVDRPGLSTAARTSSVDTPRAWEQHERGGESSTAGLRILLFMPVGEKWLGNVRTTCLTALSLNMSLFLAHYDGNGSAAYVGQPWYSQVAYSVTYPARKSDFVLRELVANDTMRAVLRSRFTHVWLTDDNVVFGLPRAALKLVQVAKTLEVEFAAPAFATTAMPIARPDRKCSAHTTDYVEIMAPLATSRALIASYSSLYRPGGSDWGLDMLWCRFVAHQLRGLAHSDYNTSRVCVIANVGPGFSKLPHRSSYNVAAAKRAKKQMLSKFGDANTSRCERFECFTQIPVDEASERARLEVCQVNNWHEEMRTMPQDNNRTVCAQHLFRC